MSVPNLVAAQTVTIRAWIAENFSDHSFDYPHEVAFFRTEIASIGGRTEIISAPGAADSGFGVPRPSAYDTLRALPVMMAGARGWLRDCGELHPTMSDREVAGMIRALYEGGIRAFVADCSPLID